jgi:hypothetical protein
MAKMAASMGAPQILPMKTAGTQHFIERTYREGGPFQWVRETLVNAIEALATRVEFGIEWQAVESLGIYRRLIADDGIGMTGDELVEFFNTFGGGGKPIGGLHQNFGVGAKTSLLPWNRHGIVVIAWVDGDPSMIWVQYDESTGEYGLRLFETEDENGEISLDEVVEPFVDDEHGCDWAAVKPNWIDDHGVVIVLLGNDPTDSTVYGDPNRGEGDIKGISSYLNRRFWEIPDSLEIYVDELRTQERANWPRSLQEARGPAPGKGIDRRTNHRDIEGARYYIDYPAKQSSHPNSGALKHDGIVNLRDTTIVHWYLWEGPRPAVQSYAAIGGYIGVLYRNELYNVTAHHSTYRSFGVAESDVRKRLWLVIEPPHGDDSKHGVYPRTDRNELLLRGGPNAGGAIPVNDWAGEFAELMATEAPELLDAIKKARAGSSGTVNDASWRDKLAERFGARWRILKLVAPTKGDQTVSPISRGGNPAPARVKKKVRRSRTTSPGTGGTHGTLKLGNAAGNVSAVRKRVGGGIPQYRLVDQSELSPGMLAAWQPNDPIYPEGAVLLNVQHPVLTDQVAHWQRQYPDHLGDQVAEAVLNTYGEIAVAKIAHSEHLKGLLPSRTVDEDLRSEAALTLALLGLLTEDAVIATRIGGRLGKQRHSA